MFMTMLRNRRSRAVVARDASSGTKATAAFSVTFRQKANGRPLRRTQDIGGQPARGDCIVHEPAVGQQALLIARLVAEDEQEQVLATAGASMDRRRDALRRAER